MRKLLLLGFPFLAFSVYAVESENISSELEVSSCVAQESFLDSQKRLKIIRTLIDNKNTEAQDEFLKNCKEKKIKLMANELKGFNGLVLAKEHQLLKCVIEDFPAERARIIQDTTHDTDFNEQAQFLMSCAQAEIELTPNELKLFHGGVFLHTCYLLEKAMHTPKDRRRIVKKISDLFFSVDNSSDSGDIENNFNVSNRLGTDELYECLSGFLTECAEQNISLTLEDLMCLPACGAMCVSSFAKMLMDDLEGRAFLLTGMQGEYDEYHLLQSCEVSGVKLTMDELERYFGTNALLAVPTFLAQAMKSLSHRKKILDDLYKQQFKSGDEDFFEACAYLATPLVITDLGDYKDANEKYFEYLEYVMNDLEKKSKIILDLFKMRDEKDQEIFFESCKTANITINQNSIKEIFYNYLEKQIKMILTTEGLAKSTVDFVHETLKTIRAIDLEQCSLKIISGIEPSLKFEREAYRALEDKLSEGAQIALGEQVKKFDENSILDFSEVNWTISYTRNNGEKRKDYVYILKSEEKHFIIEYLLTRNVLIPLQEAGYIKEKKQEEEKNFVASFQQNRIPDAE